jgi:hypothetical protein
LPEAVTPAIKYKVGLSLLRGKAEDD